MIGISLVAVHEAAHAVVFAYLRVPFSSATLKPGISDNGTPYSGQCFTNHSRIRTLSVDKQGRFTKRSSAALEQSIALRVENLVVGILAPRAALMLPQWYKAWEGGVGYEGDETDVLACSREVGVQPEDYSKWRAGLMQRAVEIVAIPFVTAAIGQVAVQLEIELKLFNKGLSSKEIRETLRYMRDQQP